MHEKGPHGLQNNIILDICLEWSEKILIFPITRRRSDSKTISQKMRVCELDQSFTWYVTDI